MKERISMQLQIPLALIIVTLFSIVLPQALSDDATTTVGRQIQSEVEINLEVLNNLPSNDLSLGIVEISKPKKNIMPAQDAKDTGSKINKTTSTNNIGAMTPPTKPIISLSKTPNFLLPKKNTPIIVPEKPNVELKKSNKEKVTQPKKKISLAGKSRKKTKKIRSASSFKSDNREKLAIIFQGEKVQLTNTEQKKLDKVAIKLLNEPDQRLQLVAYATTASENASAARRLSLLRALEIRNLLIQKGVSATTMSVRALGDRVKSYPADRVDIIMTR